MTIRWLMMAAALTAAAACPVLAQETSPGAPSLPSNSSGNTISSPSAPAGSPSEMNDLREQIRTLQQKMEDLEKEAEARRALRMSEEEKSAEEKEILTAVGREYALIPRHAFNFEYGFAYDYFSSDILKDLRDGEGSRLSVERSGNHSFTHTLTTEYGVLDNLSINFTLPFVEKWDKRSGESDLKVNDLGDINLGLQLQPFKEKADWPTTIFFVNGALPTGRSPYKINPDTELATGNGYYALGGGLSLSKAYDPVVAYGSVVYSHPFPTTDTSQLQRNGKTLDKVEAGDRVALSMGLAFAMSYKTSLSLTYQYGYHFESTYNFTDSTSFESNSWVTSSFNIGVGWRISPRYSIYVRVDIGLTNDDPDFTFSIRIPVRFEAG